MQKRLEDGLGRPEWNLTQVESDFHLLICKLAFVSDHLPDCCNHAIHHLWCPTCDIKLQSAHQLTPEHVGQCT